MDLDTQLEQALQSPRAIDDVLAVVFGMKTTGSSQLFVYRFLEKRAEQAAAAGADERRQILEAAMTYVAGMCPEEQRIWPEVLAFEDEGVAV